MDGRDIGSVVFPNAELKLFMTASEDIRAQRRYNELIAKGSEVSIEEVKVNLSKRDYIDSHRDTAPLIQTNDAIVLDNSHLSQKEQLDWVLKKQNKLVLVWDNYFMALDEPIFIEIFSNISTVFIGWAICWPLKLKKLLRIIFTFWALMFSISISSNSPAT